MVINSFETINSFVKLEHEGKDNSTKDNKRAFKEGKNWSFDLKIGDEYFLSGDDEPRYLCDENRFIIISPGKFGTLMTKEIINIDDQHIGLINIRFTYKKKGLINVSGFHVDPNYYGKIIFTVFNAGPNDIYIKKDDYMFLICFLKLETKTFPMQDTEPCKKQQQDVKPKNMTIPIGMIEGFSSNSTLMQNNKRIENLEFYIKSLGSLGVALFIGLVILMVDKL